MSQANSIRTLEPSAWELSGCLAYALALAAVLGSGFAYSLRFPEIALPLIPPVCLVILWDDRRREVARHAMPTDRIAPARPVDPLWDHDLDG
jgi:hypothetical protein